jgi:hypothetical protein
MPPNSTSDEKWALLFTLANETTTAKPYEINLTGQDGYCAATTELKAKAAVAWPEGKERE